MAFSETQQVEQNDGGMGEWKGCTGLFFHVPPSQHNLLYYMQTQWYDKKHHAWFAYFVKPQRQETARRSPWSRRLPGVLLGMCKDNFTSTNRRHSQTNSQITYLFNRPLLWNQKSLAKQILYCTVTAESKSYMPDFREQDLTSMICDWTAHLYSFCYTRFQ